MPPRPKQMNKPRDWREDGPPWIPYTLSIILATSLAVEYVQYKDKSTQPPVEATQPKAVPPKEGVPSKQTPSVVQRTPPNPLESFAQKLKTSPDAITMFKVDARWEDRCAKAESLLTQRSLELSKVLLFLAKNIDAIPDKTMRDNLAGKVFPYLGLNVRSVKGLSGYPQKEMTTLSKGLASAQSWISRCNGYVAKRVFDKPEKFKKEYPDNFANILGTIAFLLKERPEEAGEVGQAIEAIFKHLERKS